MDQIAFLYVFAASQMDSATSQTRCTILRNHSTHPRTSLS
jgi:hypothetical protein